MYRDEAQEVAFEAARLLDFKIIVRRAQIASPTNAEYLATETLVSLVHHCFGPSTAGRREVFAALDVRIRAYAGGFVGRNLDWPQLLRDPDYYREELAQAIWQELLEDSADIAFAEVRFGLFFARKATSFMRKEIRRGRTDQLNTDPDVENDYDETEQTIDALPSPEPLPEEHAAQTQWYVNLLKVAGERLTENERLAVEYHHVLEIPIEAADPQHECVARRLKLTPQRVRQILRSAEAKLREHLPR